MQSTSKHPNFGSRLRHIAGEALSHLNKTRSHARASVGHWTQGRVPRPHGSGSTFAEWALER
ncbi:MAG: hypothetical protein ABIV50_01035, partial [Opitutus sp.]